MKLRRVIAIFSVMLAAAAIIACGQRPVSTYDVPLDMPQESAAPSATEQMPIMLEIMTPAPSPTPSPTPEPTPELTGRALRAWNLNEATRARLTQDLPENSDIAVVATNMLIDPEKKLIALTFDDGPSNTNTNRILDVLEQYHARATFFVIGKRIATREAVIARAIALNCEIGNHTWGHSNFTKYTKSALIDSLGKTDAAMQQNFGYHMTLFRPPYAAINKDVAAAAKDMGYTMILWSGSTHDWSIKNADKIYRNMFECAQDGAIVLFHDIYDFTAEAVERIVPELVNQGYQLVTISELLAMDEEQVEPGDRYGGWTKRNEQAQSPEPAVTDGVEEN